MNALSRRIAESPIYQGVNARFAYQLTSTPWGDNPTSVSVVVKDVNGTDVTSTKMTGSASVNGNVITLPVLHSLVNKAEYRLEIKFTINGNVAETWADVIGQT